jgi:uncharacterized membrane protein
MSRRRIRSNHPKSPHRGNWYALWPAWALCAGLLLLAAFAVVREFVEGLPQKSDIPVLVLGPDRDLHLDSAKLLPSELHLYEASVAKQKMKFVVGRTKDNTIHAALASCRTCYKSHDRHYVKQGQMICGECNMQMNFGSTNQQAGKNSCFLVEIPHTETGRDITVLAHDVLAQVEKQPR